MFNLLGRIIKDENGISEAVWWAIGVAIAALSLPILLGLQGAIAKVFMAVVNGLNGISTQVENAMSSGSK